MASISTHVQILVNWPTCWEVINMMEFLGIKYIYLGLLVLPGIHLFIYFSNLYDSNLFWKHNGRALSTKITEVNLWTCQPNEIHHPLCLNTTPTEYVFKYYFNWHQKYPQLLLKGILEGPSKYVNKDVNICCPAGAISECICWYLVNNTPNTINTDTYFKMWIRIWASCV